MTCWLAPPTSCPAPPSGAANDQVCERALCHCGHGPWHVSRHPARAASEQDALGQLATGGSGAAPVRTPSVAGADGRHAGGCGGDDAAPGRQSALGDAEQMLRRSSADGTLPSTLAALHHAMARRPVPSTHRLRDPSWLLIERWTGVLAGACLRIAIVAMLVLTIVTLDAVAALATEARCRSSAPGQRARGRPEDSAGLLVAAAFSLRARGVLILSGDGPSIAAATVIAGLSLWFASAGRDTRSARAPTTIDTFDLLRLDRSLARSDRGAARQRAGAGAQPACAGPRRCGAPALGDRDVVVMTAQLVDTDVSEETRAAERRRRPTNGSCSQTSSPLPNGSVVRPSADRARAQCRRRDRHHRGSASLIGRVRRRIVDALGRGPGAPAGRSLGAGRQAGSRSTSAS